MNQKEGENIYCASAAWKMQCTMDDASRSSPAKATSTLMPPTICYAELSTNNIQIPNSHSLLTIYLLSNSILHEYATCILKSGPGQFSRGLLCFVPIQL